VVGEEEADKDGGGAGRRCVAAADSTGLCR
jgi:hypothetical protein